MSLRSMKHCHKLRLPSRQARWRRLLPSSILELQSCHSTNHCIWHSSLVRTRHDYSDSQMRDWLWLQVSQISACRTQASSAAAAELPFKVRAAIYTATHLLTYLTAPQLGQLVHTMWTSTKAIQHGPMAPPPWQTRSRADEYCTGESSWDVSAPSCTPHAMPWQLCGGLLATHCCLPCSLLPTAIFCKRGGTAGSEMPGCSTEAGQVPGSIEDRTLSHARGSCGAAGAGLKCPVAGPCSPCGRGHDGQACRGVCAAAHADTENPGRLQC